MEIFKTIYTSERDDLEGKEQEDNGIEEGVECEGEKNHQTHSQYHHTQLQISPVDDIEDCVCVYVCIYMCAWEKKRGRVYVYAYCMLLATCT